MDNKVPQQINDIVGDNVKKLAQLFPSAVKDGEVDFEALKEELGQFQEVGSEKYELTWAGKKEAKKIAQEDVFGRTLKFIPEDSKDADTTENLYIEGDNLEVLKMLRQNYYGAVKMIYIDPPYNTGNDFVYNDSFEMTKEEADVADGAVDELGQRYVINGKSQNKYHANWMNMMYSRLKISRDLLTDDGMVFISIDDIEVKNMMEICNEIFGEENHVETIVWKNKYGAGAKTVGFITVHEYILCYSKYPITDLTSELDEEGQKRFNKRDEKFDKRGGYMTQPLMTNSLGDRPNLMYTIEYNGTTIEPRKQWVWSKERLSKEIENGNVEFNLQSDGTYSVRSKSYLYDENGGIRRGKPVSILNGPFNQEGTQDIRNLFDNKSVFDFTKPSKLIEFLVSLQINGKTDKDYLVLDFFSGSSTTAQAVMSLNLKDAGKRKWIMVQLDEKCDKDTVAYKCGYNSITEIAKERIRRAGDKIKSEHPDADIDIGFKVFRTADTNIKWNSFMDMGQTDIKQMEYKPDLIDFMPDTNDVDVVYELMLRQRDVPLSESLEQLSDIGSRTYLYASSYLVCLETEITEELVSKLAEIDPLPIKFIFRDSAFKDDIALKDETFRRLKALIEKNAGTNKPAYTVEFI